VLKTFAEGKIFFIFLAGAVLRNELFHQASLQTQFFAHLCKALLFFQNVQM